MKKILLLLMSMFGILSEVKADNWTVSGTTITSLYMSPTFYQSNTSGNAAFGEYAIGSEQLASLNSALSSGSIDIAGTYDAITDIFTITANVSGSSLFTNNLSGIKKNMKVVTPGLIEMRNLNVTINGKAISLPPNSHSMRIDIRSGSLQIASNAPLSVLQLAPYSTFKGIVVSQESIKECYINVNDIGAESNLGSNPTRQVVLFTRSAELLGGSSWLDNFSNIFSIQNLNSGLYVLLYTLDSNNDFMPLRGIFSNLSIGSAAEQKSYDIYLAIFDHNKNVLLNQKVSEKSRPYSGSYADPINFSVVNMGFNVFGPSSVQEVGSSVGTIKMGQNAGDGVLLDGAEGFVIANSATTVQSLMNQVANIFSTAS